MLIRKPWFFNWCSCPSGAPGGSQLHIRAFSRSFRSRKVFAAFVWSALIVSQVCGSSSETVEHLRRSQSTGKNHENTTLLVPVSDAFVMNSTNTLMSDDQPVSHLSNLSGLFGSEHDLSLVRNRRHYCPSCQMPEASHHHQEPKSNRLDGDSSSDQAAGDSARLESIKRQILVKLGLNAKPNLLSTIPPRDFIMETLLRAEESTVAATPAVQYSSHQSSSGKNHHHHHTASTDSALENSVEDDFYGKTSEIIAFGEPGPKLNGQVLAEFSRVQQTAPEPSLRVKSATLWIYVHLKSTHHNHGGSKHGHLHGASEKSRQPHSHHLHGHSRTTRPPTLYIFRILPHQDSSSINSSLDKNWNELLASQRVTIQHSGWMKVNITEGVRKWFSMSSVRPPGNVPSSKLQLLIDCSGCGSNVEPILFSSSSVVSSNKQDGSKKKKKKRRRKRRRTRAVEAEESDVDMVSDGAGQERHDIQEEAGKQRHRPFIVIHTDSINSRRLRRRTPLDCSPSTSACCKQRFFVSFRALGWDDWIIAPSGYYANYCRGDCGGGPSGPSRTPDTFLSYHSHVIDQVRKLPAGSSGPSPSSKAPVSSQEDPRGQQWMKQQQQLFASLQPCCAPTKFSSMSLIYFGPDMNIIKRDLPKMVVDECGCP